MKKQILTFASALTLVAIMTVSSCKKDETPTQTITQIAAGDTTFSILVSALTDPRLSTNYATVLSGAGPYTVFAPTNAAFRSLLTELGATSLNDLPGATLEAVLKYHVVSGKVLSSSLTNGQVVSPLLTGKTFTIGLTGGAKITDGSGRVANITTTDLEATNGVVHVIDKVLLPMP
ncbi:MAG: fasciclin domain-containing protein [Bacteroidetes bacterium]|nr:fasciclin domain-containing protein [Bacteroidota bacterium]